MESIKIIRPVVIKAIMTESFRTQMLKETEDTWSTHEKAFKQMESLYENGKKTGSIKNSDLEKQIELERTRLTQLKMEMDIRVKEFKSVPEGDEVLLRIIEGPVNVKVGDDLQTILSNSEIVMKDWKVIELRGC